MTFFGQLVANGLLLGAIYALTAVAFTLVYGVVRLINFAFGELFMLGAFLCASLMLAEVRLFDLAVPMPGLPFPLAATLAILAVAGIGLLVERVAYRPLRSAPRLAPLITAIAVSVTLQSLAQVIWGAEELPFPDTALSEMPPFVLGGVHVSAVELVVLVALVVAVGGLVLLVKRTRFGKAVRAAAVDPDAARLVAIPVDRVIGLTFALGSAFAALAGILYAQAYGFAHPAMGFLPGLKALTAAVLGGIGSIPGAALGGLLLGVVETLGAGYLPQGSAYKDAIGFVILVGLLYWRPQGLMGRAELNEAAPGSLIGRGVAAARRSMPIVERWAPWLILALAAVAIWLIPSNYVLRVLLLVLIYGLLASGLNLVTGFCGLLDLGFVAFFAVGAYLSSILFVLVLKQGWGIAPGEVWWLFYVNLVLGGGLAALAAMLLGWPTLRLRGDYLAIMTLGFGEIVRIVATNWIGLTRGPMGIPGIPRPQLGGVVLTTPRAQLLLGLALVALALLAVRRLAASHVGRAWVAIRENERAAEAMGIDTRKLKLQAYSAGGFLGGTVGVFFAHVQQYVSPSSFTLFENILILLLVVLGGLGTLWGPFLGALLWIGFLQLSQDLAIVQAFPELRFALLGILLTALVVWRPQGLMGRFRPRLVGA